MVLGYRWEAAWQNGAARFKQFLAWRYASKVLTRMPDYKVIEERARSYPSIASVNGWITIPATFTPGKKVGARIE